MKIVLRVDSDRVLLEATTDEIAALIGLEGAWQLPGADMPDIAHPPLPVGMVIEVKRAK